MNRSKITRLTLALAISAGALGGTAFAAGQGQPVAQGKPAQRMQPPTTRDEAIAHADRRFTRMDTNRDGQVTKAELATLREQRTARREAQGKAMKGRAGRMAERMFARIDTDRNGAISQAEFRDVALKRFARIDTNGDGRVDTAEREAMRAKMQNRRAMRGAHSAPAPAGN